MHKFSYFLLTAILFAGTVFSQGIRDITPGYDPKTRFEQISTTRGDNDPVYVLLNNSEGQMIGMYTAENKWYKVPLPNTGKRIVSIVSKGDIIYALEENVPGNNKLYKWERAKWSTISLRKLDGNVTGIYASWGTGIILTGNFTNKNKRFYFAEYHDEILPREFEKAPAETIDLFAKSAVVLTGAEADDAIAAVLLDTTTLTFRVVFCRYGKWGLPSASFTGLPLHFTGISGQGNFIIGETLGGEPFLLKLSGTTWEPIEYSKASFEKPGTIAMGSLGKLIAAGSNKTGTGFAIDRYENGWSNITISPVELTEMAGGPNYRQYALSADRKKIYSLTSSSYYPEIAPSGFPPITEIATKSPFQMTIDAAQNKYEKERKEKEEKRKQDHATAHTVIDLIKRYAADNMQILSTKMPAYRYLTASANNPSSEAVEDANSECISVSIMLYRYINELEILKNVPPSDTALKRVFGNYLRSHVDIMQEIKRLTEYYKNSESIQSNFIQGYFNRIANFGKIHAARNEALKKELTRYESGNTIGDKMKSIGESLQKANE